MGNYTFSDIEKRKKIYNTLIKTLYRLDKTEAKQDIYRVNSNKDTIEDYIQELDYKITLVGNAIEKLSEVKNNKIAKRIRRSKKRKKVPSKLSGNSSTTINSTVVNNYEEDTGMGFLGTLLTAGLGYLIADALFGDDNDIIEEELIEPSELNDNNTQDVAELEDEDDEGAIDPEDEFDDSDNDEDYDTENNDYEEDEYIDNSSNDDVRDGNYEDDDEDDYRRYNDSSSDDSSWDDSSSDDGGGYDD